MADTIRETLSKAAKAPVDYAKNLYAQGKALVAPLDNEKAAINAKQQNISDYKKADQPAAGTTPAKASPSSYKKGGMVKKSGQAKVHKGERVLTKKQTKTFNKKGGMSRLYKKDGD